MELKKLISEVLKIEESTITDDLSFQSISEWDSLNHVSLIIALEKELGVNIDNDLLTSLTSVSKIRKFYEDTVEKNYNKTAVVDYKTISDNSQYNVHRGLNNVFFDWTSITNLDGENGILEYRGYSIDDLATYSSYEEVAYLLLFGKLPNIQQLNKFTDQLKASRNIPDSVITCLYLMKDASPTVALRTAVSLLESISSNIKNSIEETQNRGISLIAQIPIIVTTHYRIRNNLPIIQPNLELSHAANILYMLKGKTPDEKQIRIVDKILIIHAEHSSNASTFTARVVIGTQSNIYAAVTSAIAAFAGPLHGGAIEYTMKMLQEIGEPERAKSYIEERRARNEPIMGFGHRVYHIEDPRAKHLRKSLDELGQELSNTKWIELLDSVIESMKPYSKHGIHVNVDYYACIIYHLLDIPDCLFVPMFIMGRISGWTANILEQLSNNILIRPVMKYEGYKSLTYEMLEERI